MAVRTQSLLDPGTLAMSPDLRVQVHGELATPIAADEASMLIHTPKRLCPGRDVTLRVQNVSARTRVLTSSVCSLHGGITYAVRVGITPAIAEVVSTAA